VPDSNDDGNCQMIHEIGNQIEGVLWIVIAGVVAVAGWWPGRRQFRSLAALAAGILVLFGASDFVEARTGAWWEPWWLLVWKGTCIGGMAMCLVLYSRIRSRHKLDKQETP